MTAPEPVLTIRQPWASAIFLAGKDIEKRTWRTDQHGRLWIYAPGGVGGGSRPGRWARPATGFPEEPLPRGVILGCVDLVGCVEGSSSPWAVPGYVHWVLQRPLLLADPVPDRGRQGLWWRVPPSGTLVPVASPAPG